MTTTLKLWFRTIKNTLTNIGGLIVFAILYALLLVSAYFFIATREATIWQVVVTYALLILLPAEFFIFQASIIGHALDRKFHWRGIVVNAFKCFVVTIPVVLLGWGIYYLLNKWQLRYPPPVLALNAPAAPPKSQPMHWPTLIFGTLRFVIFGVALPLAAIHLWIEVAACNLRESLRSGGKAILSRLGRRFSGAFSSESVLIYALGLICFALVPYVLLFVPVTVKGNKTDFTIFILRLVLTFIFSLIGWVVTLSTLSRNASPAPEARHVVAPGVSPGTPDISEVPSPL
ncbi:MAG TPA: hypothetical protein VK557_06050 [Pyrinomonadaceae bacterium]|nr:hypothetical protein [Pyrinomonadaceae bacterium]